jgi:pimeloyl-ACP methyl ester carboxylesterase
VKTWVLLRGLTRESRHWGSFPDIFRAAIPDAQVVALDLPGCGRLANEESPTRVAAMVERCRTELRAHPVRAPYQLLAMSLGAMVAVDWASRYPDEIGAGVLINTSMRPFSPFYRRLRPRTYLPLLRALFSAHGARQREALVLRLTSSTRVDDRDTLDAWAGYWQERPVTRRNALRQVVAGARFCAPVERPASPLLVLASKNDGLVDYRCSQSLAMRWQLPLVVHPTAGHDLPLDDGAWVATQVRRWRDAAG